MKEFEQIACFLAYFCDLSVCQGGVYGGAVPADRADAHYRSSNAGCTASLDPGANKGDGP